MNIQPDRQSMFEHVVINLRKQGKRSEGHIGCAQSVSCMYRNSVGDKCAAGWLIDDLDYQEIWEGQSVAYDQDNYRSGELPVREYLIEKYGIDNLPLIERLQGIHDAGRKENPLSEWEIAWSICANEFGLKMPKKT